MNEHACQLTEPWSILFVQIEAASQRFWLQAPYQDHGRLQGPEIWSQLQRRICDLLNTLFCAAPITPFELFLLKVATLYYEAGWQVPGAARKSIEQRYRISGDLLRESFQHNSSLGDPGLTVLEPGTVEIIAAICSACGQNDLSTVSLEQVPGGQQQTVRIRYLVALLQLADLLLIPRQKTTYFHHLRTLKTEADCRLALHPYVSFVFCQPESLMLHMTLSHKDSALLEPIVACMEAPLRRWWATNWEWLARELHIVYTLKPTQVIMDSALTPALSRTCRALPAYLSSYHPAPIIVPSLEQMKSVAVPEQSRPESEGGPTMQAPSEQYIDFHLHINAQGEALSRSIEGEAKETIRQEISASLQSSVNLAASPYPGALNAALTKSFGQELYELIFPGKIHNHLHIIEAIARERGHKVRIRLNIERKELASLPLEFIYGVDRGHFLAIDPNTVLSRYLNVPRPGSRIRRRTTPLHMLTIVAAPSDQTRLNVEEWKGLVLESLAEPVAQQLLTLDFALAGTLTEIQRALLKRKPNIIQFVGHGIYAQGKCYLALVDEKTGMSKMLDDERFANLLLGSLDTLGLLCLASCESATSDDPQAFLGLAPQLLQKGIPAVIAMQYSVKISTARIFFRTLYENVASQKPIDWAVQQGRNSVSIENGNDNREFATPVLYMRAEDGTIF
ncbi:CHAT domain-containing protein [Tengunoibacter tsumagoiensis]|uniref:Uncharacterized protein n=1 Tax=Tengunoibacter tsumagoiensis TaxID=2014871 RepID=A0A402A5U7_9CHLR|nr:CHAT domain-containing protein [Tengunoibacter tsumagoiensis]GCE14508.1 hypothetical protein KTT_43670 [Tengunoibacter tsumagoiensis]